MATAAHGGRIQSDAAIRGDAKQKSFPDPPRLIKFTPFDPAKKMAEASATDSAGRPLRIVKGAYATVIALAEPSTPGAAVVDEFEKKGFRVLAVVAGDPSKPLKLMGAYRAERSKAGVLTLLVSLRSLIRKEFGRLW